MSKSRTDIVGIKLAPDQKHLSKAQKQFNTLVKQIADLKKQLREWQDFEPRYNLHVHDEYAGLRDTYNSARLELVYVFDRACCDKAFKKQEKEKLADAILGIVADLMADAPSDELKGLHDKYSDVSLEEQELEAGEVAKSMMEAILGQELGDDVDVSSPEKLHAYMQQRLAEQQAQAVEKQRELDERRAKRKKTPKQVEREEHQKNEQTNLKKSIQDIYRRLVAILHPDREPDVAERERKTELMRQLNVAYDKKDLLQMLELQLLAEKVDPSRVSAISEDRLKYYNTLLKEQVDKLFAEIEHTEMPFRMQLRLSPWEPLSPKKILAELKSDIKGLKTAIEEIREDLLVFRNPASLKGWLKNYRISRRSDHDGLADFLHQELGF